MTLDYRLRTIIANKRFFSKGRLVFRLRNFLRFNGDEETAALGFNISRMIKYKQGVSFLAIYKAFIDIFIAAFKIVLYSHRLPIHSTFAPCFFSIPGTDQNNLFFQTMTVRDFEEALEADCLREFCSENGLIVAHTYLCYTGNKHPGRLLSEFDGNVSANAQSLKKLENLGALIRAGKIDNLTLGELARIASIVKAGQVILSGSKVQLAGAKLLYREIG